MGGIVLLGNIKRKAQIRKDLCQFAAALRFGLQQAVQFVTQFRHPGLEIDRFISIDKLDVFAGDKRPPFGFNLVECCRIAILRNIPIGLFVAFTLPVVEVLGNTGNLLLRKLDVLLFERLAPLAEVDKQHLIFALPVFNQFAVLLNGAGLAVAGQNPQGDADVGGIEHIARQNHDGLDQMVFQQLTADIQLRTVAAQRAVGQQESGHAVCREFRDDIQNPTVIGIARGRHVIPLPARVLGQLVIGPPVFLVERRVGHDEIGLQILVLVVVERIGRLLAQITGNATDGEVHLRQFVGRIGVLLAIDGDIFPVAVVRLDELHALHEHTARTAARVVYLSTVGLDHFSNQIHDGLGRIVFAFSLAFGNSELAQKIFVDAANQVVLLVLEGINLANHIEQARQFGAVESQTRIIVAGQGSPQGGIVLLGLRQSRIDFDGNVVLFGILDQIVPAADFVQVENIPGIVEHGLVHEGRLAVGNQFVASLYKAVVCIFEEYQAQHHMFVLRRLHRSPQFVGRLPQSLLDTFLFQLFLCHASNDFSRSSLTAECCLPSQITKIMEYFLSPIYIF